MNTMGDLLGGYEAELIEIEKASRPADDARRAAMIQREIASGLRDADGELISPDPVESEEDDEDLDEDEGDED